MKVRLQDVVEECAHKNCWNCDHSNNNFHCAVTIGGIIPSAYIDFVNLCKHYPEQAKALYMNKEIEV